MSLNLSSVLSFCFVLLISSHLINAQNCVLQVPADPLSAAGLVQPYTVSGAGCTQTEGAGTYVQGVILDVNTGNIYVYNPLVIMTGTAVLEPITPIKLPANAVVGLWFGTNGMTTTLTATTTADGLDPLVQGNCVNGGGTPYSIFGQFAACNAAAWFDAATALINSGLLKVPPLGNDFQGRPCPTTHDFSVVDQDQSDNTDTKYISLTSTSQTAQYTPGNVAAVTKRFGAGSFTIIDNGSDELLVTLIQQAINCTRWLVLDLTDPTNKTLSASLATNELQARLTQKPLAYVPANDPMVLNGVTGLPDMNKVNAYRYQVGQLAVTSITQAPTAAYCTNMYRLGAPRIVDWLERTLQLPPPDFAATLSNTLGGVLVARFGAAVGPGGLNCQQFINKTNPLANFAINPVTLQLQLPGALLASGAVPPGQTAEAIVGVQNLQVDMTGQLGTPGLDANGNPIVTGGTTTSTTAFSGVWLAAGIGIGIAVAIIAEATYLIIKSRYQAQNKNNMNIRATL